MNQATFLAIVKKEYPFVTKEQLQLYDDGWDHFVYVVNEIHALRFPRSESHGKHDVVENAFLREFASKSPVPVHEYQVHFDRETGIQYQTYNFIPGVQFTPVLARSFSEESLSEIAKRIGLFLHSLHSFPVARAKQLHMEEIDPRSYWQYFETVLERDIKKKLFPNLTQPHRDWIRNIYISYFELSKQHPPRLVVTHSDLTPEHILLQEDTHKITGIIDFSLRLADNAYDFSYFDRYGEKFLQSVIASYGNDLIDEHFNERRKFYAGRFGVDVVLQAIEKKLPQQEVEKRMVSLTTYIASHPIA